MKYKFKFSKKVGETIGLDTKKMYCLVFVNKRSKIANMLLEQLNFK